MTPETKGKQSPALLLSAVMLVVALHRPPPLWADALPVRITRSLSQFQVQHGKNLVTVMRNQNMRATIAPEFALTSRRCPPFCAQPLQVDPRVVTVGVVEVIHFMMHELKEGTGLLVDARTPDWHVKGTIPGSINIPYADLTPVMVADPLVLAHALARLGVQQKEDGKEWDFSQAKTALLWCNGPWCGQTPTAIQSLLSLGYPAEKLLYYHGGMQSWQGFGLTVVPPAE